MPFDTAAAWIESLQLSRHIEGGWYREVYRSAMTLDDKNSPGTATALCTHIYFLLEKNDFSALHRIRSDEQWHFYAGSPLTVYEIQSDGQLVKHMLGNNPDTGHLPHCVIQGGNWFAARMEGEGAYCLVGCTVAPGFEFADLEMAKANELSAHFPAHEDLIRSLCRH